MRYLAHRGLEAVHGEAAAGPFDFLARPADRDRAAASTARPVRRRARSRRPLPYLPLTPHGLPDEAVLRRLLRAANDPDLTINE